MPKEGQPASADNMYKAWMDINQQSLTAVGRNTQVFDSAVRLIETYTAWLGSAAAFNEALMAPAYASREDVEHLAKEVRKLKAEKRAAAKAEKPAVEAKS